MQKKKLLIAAVIVGSFAMLLVLLYSQQQDGHVDAPRANVISDRAPLNETFTVREYRVGNYDVTEFPDLNTRCFKFEKKTGYAGSGGLSCVEMNSEQ